MTNWTTAAWVGFDTETTGIDTASDRIIQAAIVNTRGDTKTWLINPGVPIAASAQAVHGISDELVAKQGLPPAEALAEIGQLLVAAKRENCPIVAYNGAFDLRILMAELGRHGLADLAAQLADGFAHLIDPLLLDRYLDRYRRGRRVLAAVAAHYGVSPEGAYHDARADVEVTLGVLAAQVQRYPELASLDLPELYQLQQRAHTAWAENFNQWLQSRGRKPDVELEWNPLGRDEAVK